MTTRRRSFLISISQGAGATALLLAWGGCGTEEGAMGGSAEDEPEPEQPTDGSPKATLSIALDLLLPRQAALVGKLALDAGVVEPGTIPDLQRLFPGDDWDTIDGAEAMERLRKQVRREFKSEPLVNLKGWRLSPTEVDLAVLAHLLKTKYVAIAAGADERATVGMLRPKRREDSNEPK